MQQQEQEHDRTEPATPFKRSEAKKRGQVAKSLDFNTMVIVAGFCVVFTIGAGDGLTHLAESCARLFGAAGRLAAGDAAWGAIAGEFGRGLVGVLLPIFAAAVVLAIVANIVQTGPVLSSHPIKPQFSRLNPVSGFKRVYNKRMLFEAAKALLKLALFAVIVAGFFVAIWPSLPMLEIGDAAYQAGWFAEQMKTLMFRILLVLVLIGLLDFVWSRFQFSRQLRMSRREMKEEVKRREGDPLVRQRIRELQRENLKQARSIGRVRDADVLITNPDHLAIALRYDRDAMHAPYVVAMGADLWAGKMKAVARRHGVVLLERKPLARLLFRLGEIDRPIPVECYVDVARIYAQLPQRVATVRASASASPGVPSC